MNEQEHPWGAIYVQAVAVSLEPEEQGGEVKLNLEALQDELLEPSPSLPAVRTSITSMSPRKTSNPSSPVTSEIQPALSDSHQVSSNGTPTVSVAQVMYVNLYICLATKKQFVFDTCLNGIQR